MSNGQYSSVMLIATDGLLQNQGIGINLDLLAALYQYNNLPLIQPLIQTIQQGAGSLQPSTIFALQSIGALTVPGLSNSIPAEYSPTLTPYLGTITPGLSGEIISAAYLESGNGDISKFIQAINTALGYIQFTDQFVTSAVNSQTYLADTFTNMNNMITGDITEVTSDSRAFGQDLLRLGNIINLQELNDLGSPALLLYQITSQLGVLPEMQVAFTEVGLDQSVVFSLNDPKATFSDTTQRLMYEGMKKITGVNLANILKALRITTAGLDTMADLLNPVKLFPNSYLSLKVVTVDGEQPVYVNTNTINPNLISLLPPYFMS
jgi:hypothetical protein